MERFIYLDNSASTKVADEVLADMLPYFSEYYAVPSSQFSHQMGQKAKEALDESRSKIAKFIGATPEEIVFTSGGTESNNLAIMGFIQANPGKKHIITSKIEHYSVLHTIMRLENQGYNATYLDVDKEGNIDIEQLEDSITSDTALVSLQSVNHEVGTIQAIAHIATICQKKGVPLHTDAVLSFGWNDFDVAKTGVDMASFSAHKFYGPKGVGALYVKKGVKLRKILEGGYSEHNLRPGILNLPGIVGFASATGLKNATELKEIKRLRDIFINRVLAEIPYAKLNGPKTNRQVNNVNITFYYIEGEAIVLHLDMLGIQVVTGSACFSRALAPSHVLMAMGLTHEEAHGSIRFSFSRYNKFEAIDETIKALKKVVNQLRDLSPVYNEGEGK